MNAATLMARLRTFRPAITTVVVLALLAGLFQVAGRAPSASLAEPPAFTVLPQGDDVSRLGPVTVTFAIDGRVIGDAPGSDPALLWPLELGGHTLRASARFADGSFATATSAFEVKR